MTRILRSADLAARSSLHPKTGTYYSLSGTPRSTKPGSRPVGLSLTAQRTKKPRADPIFVRHIADVGPQSQRFADESLDVESDIIRLSQRRDVDLLSKINKALTDSEPRYAASSSLASNKPSVCGSVRTPLSNKRKTYPQLIKAVRKNVAQTSVAPPPKVIVQLETVRHPSQLLSRENRMLANETVDLSPPISCSAMRQQLSKMRESLGQHGELIDRHLNSGDDEVEQVLRSVRKSRSENIEGE